ncbi:glycosyltransferase [Flavicella marina]|uniref:glycosyltransferase n=1 Tax=Flavicella marina TaxID=1475951 RepID=UPI0012656396|nr:glycosyltransferase [Flavicella marina]
MKKILFIVNNGKISPNENGGAAVYFSHLELLHSLGYKIHLLAVQWGKDNLFIEEDYNEVTHLITSVNSFRIKHEGAVSKRSHLYHAIFKPEKFEYLFLNKSNHYFLTDFIQKNKIDMVWAEWRWAGFWAGFSKLSIPVFYAHHDWQFKVAKLRKKRNFLELFHIFQKKRAEYKLVKKVTACVSGSNTEANEIEQVSRKKAMYLPTTYASIENKLTKNNVPNIVHLGGMGTTANRVGLERFLDICWKEIKKANPQTKLWVIGSIKQANDSLKIKLTNDRQIVCKGFVADLSTVLHPQDIHIIPWEYDTGTRTRLPVILNYQQVLVATKASVAAFPEVRNQENSVLCDDLDQMTIAMNRLLTNESERVRLSNQGKEVFRKNFTVESRVKQLKEFIENTAQ